MPKYSYDGPVMLHDTIVERRWVSETQAPSKAKARSNLTYQYKKKNGYEPFSAISLPGEINVEHDESQMVLDIEI